MLICTQEEVNRVARAAKKVGGYDELIRLQREMQEFKGPIKVVVDKNGKYRIEPKE